jgi:hypothetical protein
MITIPQLPLESTSLPATCDVLRSLAAVRDVLADPETAEDDRELGLELAASDFRRAFAAATAEHGLGDWDELARLLAFEAALLADRDLDVGLAVACATVRESIADRRRRQASLN